MHDALVQLLRVNPAFPANPDVFSCKLAPVHVRLFACKLLPQLVSNCFLSRFLLNNPIGMSFLDCVLAHTLGCLGHKGCCLTLYVRRDRVKG